MRRDPVGRGAGGCRAEQGAVEGRGVGDEEALVRQAREGPEGQGGLPARQIHRQRRVASEGHPTSSPSFPGRAGPQSGEPHLVSSPVGLGERWWRTAGGKRRLWRAAWASREWARVRGPSDSGSTCPIGTLFINQIPGDARRNEPPRPSGWVPSLPWAKMGW